MNAMPNPPQDPGQWVTNADHAWSLLYGIVGAIGLGVAFIVRRVRWADRIEAELQRTRDTTEEYRSATENALAQYQASTVATLARLDEKLDLAQEQRDRWEDTVQRRIDGIHGEFKGDFRTVHERIDGVLTNCVRIEKI